MNQFASEIARFEKDRNGEFGPVLMSAQNKNALMLMRLRKEDGLPCVIVLFGDLPDGASQPAIIFTETYDFSFDESEKPVFKEDDFDRDLDFQIRGLVPDLSDEAQKEFEAICDGQECLNILRSNAPIRKAQLREFVEKYRFATDAQRSQTKAKTEEPTPAVSYWEKDENLLAEAWENISFMRGNKFLELMGVLGTNSIFNCLHDPNSRRALQNWVLSNR